MKETEDSNEELYFQWWLDDLKQQGYIDRYIREPFSFQLSDKTQFNYKKATQLKTKVKVEDKLGVLLEEHIYTPDYKVFFTAKALNVFVIPLDEYSNESTLFIGIPLPNGLYESIIEVKADFDRNNMTRLFIINQKWTYDKYNVYVELVKLPSFFRNTFTPQRYLFKDKTKGMRKINFKYRNINQFVDSLKPKTNQITLF